MCFIQTLYVYGTHTYATDVNKNWKKLLSAYRTVFFFFFLFLLLEDMEKS